MRNQFDKKVSPVILKSPELAAILGPICYSCMRSRNAYLRTLGKVFLDKKVMGGGYGRENLKDEYIVILKSLHPPVGLMPSQLKLLKQIHELVNVEELIGEQPTDEDRSHQEVS